MWNQVTYSLLLLSRSFRPPSKRMTDPMEQALIEKCRPALNRQHMGESILVTIRIPTDTLRLIDQRPGTRTSVIIAALESYLGMAEPASQKPAPPARHNPLSIPGVFLGSQLAADGADDAPMFQDPVIAPCGYREWSDELGGFMVCGLPAHPLRPRAHGAWRHEGEA